MKQKLLLKQEGRTSSLLLKLFALVALMLCSANGVWAQDASFTLGQYVESYTDNGETIKFVNGGYTDVQEGYTNLSQNASITFSGNRLRYVRITFRDVL